MRILLILGMCGFLFACRTNVTPEQQAKDLEITTSVKAKLASGLGVSTVPDISVDATNGVVTLSGQVDSESTKAKAETIAESVPNVVRVVNSLQVSAAQAPTSSRSSPAAAVSTTGG